MSDDSTDGTSDDPPAEDGATPPAEVSVDGRPLGDGGFDATPRTGGDCPDGAASEPSGRPTPDVETDRQRGLDVSRPSELLPDLDDDELLMLESEAESYAERARRNPHTVTAEVSRIRELLTKPVSDAETEVELARRARAAEALEAVADAAATEVTTPSLVDDIETLLEEEYRRGRRVGSSAALSGAWTESAKIHEHLAGTLGAVASVAPDVAVGTTDTLELLLDVDDAGIRAAAEVALREIALTELEPKILEHMSDEPTDDGTDEEPTERGLLDDEEFDATEESPPDIVDVDGMSDVADGGSPSELSGPMAGLPDGFASKRGMRPVGDTGRNRPKGLDVSRPSESLPADLDDDELLELESAAESYAERSRENPGAVAVDLPRIRELLTEPISDAETEVELARRAHAAEALEAVADAAAARIATPSLVADVETLLEEEYRRSRTVGSSDMVSGSWAASAKIHQHLAGTLGSLASVAPDPVAETVPTLELLLNADDAGIREAAIDALGSIALTEAGATADIADTLRAELGNEEVTRTAVRSLDAIAREDASVVAGTVGDVRPLFEHDDATTRYHAVSVAEERVAAEPSKLAAVLPDLEAAVIGDEDNTKVIEVTLRLLNRGVVHDPDAVAAAVGRLDPYLVHESDGVRTKAARLLNLLVRHAPVASLASADALASVLEEQEGDEFRPTVVALARAVQATEEATLPAPLEALLTHEDESVRDHAQFALHTLVGDDDAGIERVVALCEADEPLVVSAALQTVGTALTNDEFEAEGVVDAGIADHLAACLDHDHPEVRKHATNVTGLVARADTAVVARGDVVDPLVDRLSRGDEVGRTAAVMSLYLVTKHDPERGVDAGAVDVFADHVAADDETRQRVAAGGLAHALRADPEVRPRVVEFLTRDDEAVRKTMINGLAEAGSAAPDVLETVTSLLDADGERVRLGGVTAGVGVAKQIDDPADTGLAAFVTRVVDLAADESVDASVRRTAGSALEHLGNEVPGVFDAEDVATVAAMADDEDEDGVGDLLRSTVARVGGDSPGVVLDADAVGAIAALLTGEELAQRIAARALWNVASEEPAAVAEADAVPRLVDLQTHGNAGVRAEAARALAQFAGEDPDVAATVDIDMVVGLLSHGNDTVESSAGIALAALASHDDDAKDALAGLFGADDQELQYHAAGTLGVLARRAPSVVSEIATVDGVAGLLASESEDVRAMARQSLGAVGATDAGCRSLLVGLLSHRDDEVRAGAIRAVRQRAVGDDDVRDLVVDHLDTSDDRLAHAALLVVATVAAQSADDVVDAVPTLVDLFTHDDTEVREGAVTALGHVADDTPSVVTDADGAEAIVRVLDDEREETRGSAVETLLKIAQADPSFVVDAGGMAALVERFDDDVPAIRRLAIRTVGIVADELPEAAIEAGAASPLVGSLTHEDEDVREAAVRSLHRVADGERDAVFERASVDALFECLADGDDEAVRRVAANVLQAGAATDAAVVARLARLFEDGDEVGRRLAGAALAHGATEAPELLVDAGAVDTIARVTRRNPDQRSLGIRLLGTVAGVAPDAVRAVADPETFVDALGHDDETTRMAAAETLGVLGRDDAARAVVETALNERLGASDPATQLEAVTLLSGVAATNAPLAAALVSPAEFAPLLDHEDDAVQDGARSVLVKVRTDADAARSVFEGLLDHDDEDLRRVVGRGLAVAARDEATARDLVVDYLAGDATVADATEWGLTAEAFDDAALRSFLADCLDHDDGQVRTRSLSVFETVAEGDAETLAGDDDVVRALVALLDRAEGDRLGRAMVTVARVARASADPLVDAGAVPTVVSLLDHDDERIRKLAVKTVSHLSAAAPAAVADAGGVTRAVDLVTGASEFGVQATTTLALLAVENPDAVREGCGVGTLCDLLDHDDDAVRTNVAVCLSCLARDDPGVLDALEAVDGGAAAVGDAFDTLLAHGDERARRAAGQLVLVGAETGAFETTPAVALLTHEERDVRAVTAHVVADVFEAVGDEGVGLADVVDAGAVRHVLTHDEEAVRAAGIRALVRLADGDGGGDEEEGTADPATLTAEVVVDAVGGMDAGAKQRAGRALVSAADADGGRALLTGVLRHDDEAVGQAATRWLADAATTDDAVRAFVAESLDAAETAVQRRAVAVLERLGEEDPTAARDAASVGSLAHLLTHDEEAVREATEAALRPLVADPDTRPLCADLLAHEDGSVAEAAAGVVASVAADDGSVLSFLADGVDGGDGGERLRKHAVRILADVASDAPEAVAETGVVGRLDPLFDHEDEDVRTAAADCLGRIAGSDAVTVAPGDVADAERFGRLLEHGTEDVQRAARTVVAAADPTDPSVQATVRALLAHEDEAVRETTGRVLLVGAADDADTVAFLTASLTGTDDSVQYHAAGILGSLARDDPTAVVDADALDPLCDLLGHPDDEVRAHALGAIHHAVDNHPEDVTDAVPAGRLADLLTSGTAAVREQAVRICWLVAEGAAATLADADVAAALADLSTHDDVEVQRAAVGTVNALAAHDPETVAAADIASPLADLLTHDDEDLQRTAGTVLGRLAAVDEDARETLVDCLTAAEIRRQYHAAGMVSVLGQASTALVADLVPVDDFATLLVHDDDEVVSTAASAVGALDVGVDAGRQFVTALLTHEDEAIREVTSHSIAASPSVARAELLFDLVDRSAGERLRIAMRTLARLAETDRSPVVDADIDAVGLLTEYLDSEVDGVAKAAGTTIGYLAVVDEGARETLVDCLTAAETRRQYHAAGMVSVLGQASTALVADLVPVDDFATLLVHDDDGVKRVAAEAIGELDWERESGRAFVGALLTHEDEAVAQQAVEAVVGLAVEEDVSPTPLLGHGSEDVQSEAARVLRHLLKEEAEAGVLPESDLDVLAELVACLEAETRSVQYHAAGVLGLAAKDDPAAVADAGALEPLADLLGHHDDELRKVALDAIYRVAVEDPDAAVDADTLDPLVDTLRSATTGLKKKGAATVGTIASSAPAAVRDAGALDPLVDLLTGGDEEMRALAAITLQRVGAEDGEAIADPDTVDALVDCLSTVEDARASAGGALGAVADHDPSTLDGHVDALIDVLDDPETDLDAQRSVGAALDKLAAGDPAAVADADDLETLVGGMSHPDAAVHRACGRAVFWVARDRRETVARTDIAEHLPTLLGSEDDGAQAVGLQIADNVSRADEAAVLSDPGVLAALDRPLDGKESMAALRLVNMAARRAPERVVEHGPVDGVVTKLDANDELHRRTAADALGPLLQTDPTAVDAGRRDWVARRLADAVERYGSGDGNVYLSVVPGLAALAALVDAPGEDPPTPAAATLLAYLERGDRDTKRHAATLLRVRVQEEPEPVRKRTETLRRLLRAHPDDPDIRTAVLATLRWIGTDVSPLPLD
jgi:hypothetical protein